MLSRYRRIFKIIERIFGESWLKNKRGAPGTKLKSRKHPIQNLWKDSHRVFRHVTAGNTDLRGIDGLSQLEDYAGILEIAVGLENFEKVIRPRLTDVGSPENFYPALYEARVAARHASAGRNVRFVQPSQKIGIRTVDLEVDLDAFVLPIECKRKDRIIQKPLSAESRERLSEAIRSLLWTQEANFDLVIQVIGEPEPQVIEDLGAELKAIFAGNSGSTISRPKEGLWAAVYERPAPPPGARCKLASLPHDLQPGIGTFVLSLTNNNLGNNLFETLSWRTGSLFVFDSHSFRSVVNTFNQARPQIANDEVGVVYIDLDAGGMSRPQLERYMSLMLSALSEHAWAGGQNTRIGALALSCGPITDEFRDWPWITSVKRHAYMYRISPNDIFVSQERSDKIEAIRNHFARLG